jgi:hypothetical protein
MAPPNSEQARAIAPLILDAHGAPSVPLGLYVMCDPPLSGLVEPSSTYSAGLPPGIGMRPDKVHIQLDAQPRPVGKVQLALPNIQGWVDRRIEQRLPQVECL